MCVNTRILLVEDDADQAQLYTMVLSLAGYQVTTAVDAERAAAQYAQAPVDLVLSDWNLPGMRGDQFLGTLVHAHLPVKTVLMSNHASVEHAAKCCGADAWFYKGSPLAQLKALIAGLLTPAMA
ncbi:MAG TPA: response regulator [Armatimonadota bacterium]|jgi:DNA-binding NtrC family response regulator